MRTTRKGRKIALGMGGVVLAAAGLAAWLYWPEIRGWYLLWRDFESIGKNAQGYPEYRHRQTGIVFVGLPGGEFWMGTSEGEAQNIIEEFARQGNRETGSSRRRQAAEFLLYEQPLHKVTLNPFLIAKFEVRQAEWEEEMKNNRSARKDEDLPVENVTWQACKEFCRKTGLSLPTEAQWEYACRGGTRSRYSSGDTEQDLGRVAWYHKNSGGRTHPRGEKHPNSFGLHDMHGNVWEWCEDVWDPGFYANPDAAGPDPICTAETQERAIRGGCYSCYADNCRSARRLRFDLSYFYPHLGFRPTWSSDQAYGR